MAVRRNVLQDDDILFGLYADRSSSVSDFSDSESLDSDRDSDVPTSSRKQLRSSVIIVTSDSKTSATGEESSELENSDKKQVMCGIKRIKNQPMSVSLESQV